MMSARDRKTSIGTACLSAAVVLSASIGGFAEDRFPPVWRGDGGSAFQHWHFPPTNPGGPAPDALSNTFGSPALTVQGESTGGASWLTDFPVPPAPGAQGVWLLSDEGGGRLDFTVTNAASGQDQKTVRVQITYAEGSAGAPVVRVMSATGELATLSVPPVITDLQNGYVYHLSLWTFPNCPPSETVFVSAAGGPGGGGSTYIDQVVIDTICGDPPPRCDGDIDGNGIVSLAELTCIISGLGDPALCPNGDVDGDGLIDGCDVNAALCFFRMEQNCCAECPGACCIGGDRCTVSTQATCETPPPLGLGGTYLGVGSLCDTENVVAVVEPGGDVFVHHIGPPVDCRVGGSARRVGPCGAGPFFDPWKSPAHGQMCHSFGVADSPPIPADFFAPGSDPFTGTICLEGVPLGTTAFGSFGDADTIIQRSADPFDPAAPATLPATAQPVSIEVVALSMVGTGPITVTFNGGQNPEDWDTAVDLSSVTPAAGTLTATKTHCNGGTYTSIMNVQPRFTFTKVLDPVQVRVLDTGLAGITPVTLVQDLPAPWSHDVGTSLGLMDDPCTAFHAGVADAVVETESCAAVSTIPTVSQWGLFAMAILVIAAGALLQMKRKSTAT